MTFVQSLNSMFDFVDKFDKVTLFYTIVVFFTLMFIWENYLSIRQVSLNFDLNMFFAILRSTFWNLFLKTRVEKKTKNLPKELIGVIDNETFEKSRSYAIDKGVYNLIRGTYSMFEAYVIDT